MKNLLVIFVIVAGISGVAFGFGWQLGRSSTFISIAMAVVALLACLWIALFGYYGFGTSVGAERWIVLALGFLPLTGLMVGYFVARQSA